MLVFFSEKNIRNFNHVGFLKDKEFLVKKSRFPRFGCPWFFQKDSGIWFFEKVYEILIG